MNDQRPLDEQLRDAYVILNQHGLYDAADYVRRGIGPAFDRRQGCGKSGNHGPHEYLRGGALRAACPGAGLGEVPDVLSTF